MGVSRVVWVGGEPGQQGASVRDEVELAKRLLAVSGERLQRPSIGQHTAKTPRKNAPIRSMSIEFRPFATLPSPSDP